MAMTREQIEVYRTELLTSLRLINYGAVTKDNINELCALALSALPDRASDGAAPQDAQAGTLWPDCSGGYGTAAPPAGRGEGEDTPWCTLRFAIKQGMSPDTKLVFAEDYDTLLQRLAEMTERLEAWKKDTVWRMPQTIAEWDYAAAIQRAAQSEALLAQWKQWADYARKQYTEATGKDLQDTRREEK